MERLIAVVGPTATGKSSLALRLAQELGGEIVNADALQLYRGLDVGTAKPTPAMREAVPHHLIDVLEPHESSSAGEFARRARTVIAEIERRDRTAILVGGSGLYLRALLAGLSPVPQSDPEVRRAVAERLEREGLAVLYDELRRCDPETAARLAPGDRQRITRALEVFLTSGRPLASWICDRPLGGRPLRAFIIGLTMPRSILYDRISGRVFEMVQRGWVAEVEKLLKQGVGPEVPAFQAIGYRQIVRYVLGDWSLEVALDETIRATRRYAKRQVTWFRKEEGIRWVSALNSEASLGSLLHELAAANQC